MTYSLLSIIIQKKRYVYDDMMAKLDLFYALSRITAEQYVELSGMLIPEESTEETTV